MINFASKVTVEDNYLKVFDIPIPIEYLMTLLSRIIKIIIIIVIMSLLIKLGNAIINKIVKKQIESNTKFSLDEKKAYTFGSILKSILRYTVYFIGITAVLTVIFGPISITLASVGGVAIGFGAQTLVKDIINGLFILFENQFSVGDYVTLGDFKGIVENIGLRTTVLKDFSGEVHILPNSTIAEVTNHSVADSRMLVDIEIAYEENIDEAIEIINKVCDDFKDSSENIVEAPKAAGVISLNESGVTIRVTGKAKAMTNWGLENDLRKRIKLALDKAEIEIPYPKTQLVNRQVSKLKGE